MEKNNIVPHSYKVLPKDRKKINKHNSFLVWFTGLSGSGKSTLANRVEYELWKKGVKTYTLDGDNVRKGINKDLIFSPEDRSENVRRVAEISKLMMDAGLIILAAFISPYKKDRDHIKRIVEDNNFIEVYVNSSIEECERRDTKGLYKKARAGDIKNMTGINAPYEAPINPDIEIKTEEVSVEQAVQKILKYITPKLQLKDE